MGRRVLAVVFCLMLLTGQVLAQIKTAIGDGKSQSSKSIFENALASRDHSTLVAAFKAAGLDSTLEGPGPYTVFAPTNEAFTELPAGTVQALFKPDVKEKLNKILRCHVVSGDYTSEELLAKVNANNGALILDTIGGCPLTVRAAGSDLSVSDNSGDVANITVADVHQSNGMVFVVNKVLASTSSNTSHEIHASRIFAGPNEYPPTNFAAYGIIAFRSKISSYDQERQKMLCEAFVNAVLPSSALTVPTSSQMVTVWPMDSADHARATTTADISNTCESALHNYGLATSLKAIKDAAASGVEVNGDGPFLIAWAPPTEIGKPGAVVLKADLTGVENYKVASDIMHRWVVEIENKPELWRSGAFDRSLIVITRDWADHYGSMILSVIGLK
ncbi:Beta-Ig-H3/fasciclin (modular protein) [Mesorhizobium plurifarium]|uniref:Beta-Ig-H3/fasciclin (Modular protein) n=1 Tax=Mesorhizobium plurifarium TaxID=69974 RepID=A0A090GCL4_MESPL|nr:Beta-Ig-H3/fasciclin (modular protein) [Mesorhizobium plurifarium]